MANKIRLLFLAADPVDAPYRPHLAQEFREIQDRIRAGPYGNLFEIISQWAVRPQDLQYALSKYRPDIVHFTGSGTTKGLVLENKFGRKLIFKKAALTKILKMHADHIRIVFLNACHSSSHSKLLQREFEFSVVMNKPINDQAAINFASYFYEALALGHSVGRAFKLAKARKKAFRFHSHTTELFIKKGSDASEPFVSIVSSRPNALVEKNDIKLPDSHLDPALSKRTHIRLLFLAADPVNVYRRLNLSKEFHELEDRIRAGPYGNLFEIISQWAVRPQDLQYALSKYRPDIVHFGGHGSTRGLILENSDGTHKAVNKNRLSNLFSIFKARINIVFMNTCYSRSQVKAVNQFVDFTIGMKGLVEDKVAIMFAGSFYDALARGLSVTGAFKFAENDIAHFNRDEAGKYAMFIRDGVESSSSFISANSPARVVAVYED